jgi:hypothetical protein
MPQAIIARIVIGETGRLEPLAMATELRSPLVANRKPGKRPETSGDAPGFSFQSSGSLRATRRATLPCAVPFRCTEPTHAETARYLSGGRKAAHLGCKLSERRYPFPPTLL